MLLNRRRYDPNDSLVLTTVMASLIGVVIFGTAIIWCEIMTRPLVVTTGG
jgi:hypothetical protein